MSRITRQEAENTSLVETLSTMHEPEAQELAARMARCRADRIYRRDLGRRMTVGEALRTGPQFKCKTVACWACRMAHVRRKKAQAESQFAAATNETCSFMSINAAEPAANLDDVAAVHRKFVDDIDNWRNALAKKDRRFRRLSVFAVLEIGRDGTMWRPHWHAVVYHHGLDREEIVDAARRYWSGSRRVNIRKFDGDKEFAQNVGDCVGYAFKFNHSDWSAHSSASLFLWIRRQAALRSMTKIMRPTGATRRVVKSFEFDRQTRGSEKTPLASQAHFDEPMPMLLGDMITFERGHLGNWCVAQPVGFTGHGIAVQVSDGFVDPVNAIRQPPRHRVAILPPPDTG